MLPKKNTKYFVNIIRHFVVLLKPFLKLNIHSLNKGLK